MATAKQKSDLSYCLENRIDPALRDRFTQKFDIQDCGFSTPCWIWRGAKNQKGYGIVRVNRYKLSTAHRVAYTVVHGDVPDGKQLDHLCRNRACCNPDHLEAVTSLENTRRGIASRRNMTISIAAESTECKHEYTDTGNGTLCRICGKDMPISVTDYRDSTRWWNHY